MSEPQQKTNIFGVLKEAGQEFISDKAPRLAASLSYYTLFSVAPLLIICIAIAGIVFGQEAARGEIVAALQGLLGETAAKSIEGMIANAGQKETRGALATMAGIVMLLIGASGVFGQLKDALNTIWEVEPKPGGGILGILKGRFLSFSMVLGVGFLLLVSLVITAGLAAMGRFMESRLPGGETLWQILNFAISVGVITVLFAMIFRYLPDAHVRWKNVWAGAAFTSLLFALGKIGIGIYLGKGTFSSTYGAAASLVVLLIWVHYSSMIVFFGAEFTEVYSRRIGGEEGFGERAERSSTDRERAHQPAALARARREREATLRASLPEQTKKGGGVGGKIAIGAAGCGLGMILGIGAGLWAGIKGMRKLVPF